MKSTNTKVLLKTSVQMTYNSNWNNGGDNKGKIDCYIENMQHTP